MIQKIIEKFHRDEAVVADRDIARREFDISNEEFNLNYHYAEGKITAGTRYFIKPPVTEQGDRLKFDSKLTSGYVVSKYMEARAHRCDAGVQMPTILSEL